MKRTTNEIKCFLLILNLVISIIAFSGVIGFVSAQGGSTQKDLPKPLAKPHVETGGFLSDLLKRAKGVGESVQEEAAKLLDQAKKFLGGDDGTDDLKDVVEGEGGGLWHYKESPVIFQSQPECESARKAQQGEDTTKTISACKKFNLQTFLEAGGELTPKIKESIRINQNSMDNGQKLNYLNKIAKDKGMDVKISGNLNDLKFGKDDSIILKGEKGQRKIPLDNLKKVLEEKGVKEIEFLGGGRARFTTNLGSAEVDLYSLKVLNSGGFLNIKTLMIIGAIGIAIFLIMSKSGKKKVTSENGKIKTTLEEGASTRIVGEGGENIAVGQNDPSQPAIVVSSSATQHSVTNANLVIENQVAASIPTSDTQVVLQGIPGDDPNNPPSTDTSPPAQLTGTIVASGTDTGTGTSGTGTDTGTTTTISLPLLKPTITGKQIANNIASSQSLVLNNHDLGINGHDINAHALKTFNDIRVGGQNLRFFSGNLEFFFFNQKTYVSRTFSNVDHGFKVMANKLNPGKTFELKKYTNRQGQLEDKNGRVTFGDIITEYYPTGNPRERLIASKQREKMLEIYT